MELIPVIDLMGGRCVHAQKGLRHLYRPLAPFGDGLGTPNAVVAAYLTLAPFKTLYLADLDALTGKRPQWALIESLAENFPELRFWVDAAGISPPAQLEARVTRVIGSESLPFGLEGPLSEDVILSLDYQHDVLVGSRDILKHPERWPPRVILMNLSLVGSLDGPDLPLLLALRNASPASQLIAAGGVRHAQDLEDLAALGISGVLLASALHQGALEGATLRRFILPP